MAEADFFSRAHGLSNEDGGAHGKSHNHHGEHVHDLRTDGDGGSAGDTFKLADDK